MGYPMTVNRVLNRNGLAAGGYGTPLRAINTGKDSRTMLDTTPEDFQEGVDFTEVLKGHIRHLYGAIDEMNAQWGSLCGDLRRLEKDTVDEKSLCQNIAMRTGIDPEVVAAVLAEWMRV